MEYSKLGRFHLGEVVAEGGMGKVTLSKDDRGLPIALKTILDEHDKDERFRDLFIREAEITFHLNHRNIVKAFRFDQIGNRLCLALEYLEGLNLKDVLRKVFEKKILIPQGVAFAIIERVLDGLDYAHKKRDRLGRGLGIIHRDLNPSNIFVTFGGEVKILDFGISKATQKDIHQLTPKQELRGKVCYLSPEQLQDAPLDHRVDIFCMGIVLWECLAGRPLFLRKSETEAMEAIMNGEYRALSEFRRDISPEIENVIKKALSVKRGDRFHDCAEFKESLKKAVKTSAMPGASETEIAIFVKALFQGELINKNDAHFLSGYYWLMSQIPGQESRALKNLQDLAESHPTVPLVQLNFARVLMSCGNKTEGLRILKRLARSESKDPKIDEILEWLGVRRPPVLSFLGRENPVNFLLGKIRHQMKGPTSHEKEFLSA